MLRALREAREGVGAAVWEGGGEGGGDWLPERLLRGEAEEEGLLLAAALPLALALGVPPAPPGPAPTEAVRWGERVLVKVKKVTSGLALGAALPVPGEGEAVPLAAPLALLLSLH